MLKNINTVLYCTLKFVESFKNLTGGNKKTILWTWGEVWSTISLKNPHFWWMPGWRNKCHNQKKPTKKKPHRENQQNKTYPEKVTGLCCQINTCRVCSYALCRITWSCCLIIGSSQNMFQGWLSILLLSLSPTNPSSSDHLSLDNFRAVRL